MLDAGTELFVGVLRAATELLVELLVGVLVGLLASGTELLVGVRAATELLVGLLVDVLAAGTELLVGVRAATELLVEVLRAATELLVLGAGTELFVGVVGAGTEPFVGVVARSSALPADVASLADSASVARVVSAAGSAVVGVELVVVRPAHIGNVAIDASCAAATLAAGVGALDGSLSLPHDAMVHITLVAIAILVRIFIIVLFEWSRGIPVGLTGRSRGRAPMHGADL